MRARRQRMPNGAKWLPSRNATLMTIPEGERPPSRIELWHAVVFWWRRRTDLPELDGSLDRHRKSEYAALAIITSFNVPEVSKHGTKRAKRLTMAPGPKSQQQQSGLPALRSRRYHSTVKSRLRKQDRRGDPVRVCYAAQAHDESPPPHPSSGRTHRCGRPWRVAC